MRERDLAVLLVLCALAACANHTSPAVQASGFLDDYSQLEVGRGDQVQLRYISGQANFARYDKMLIDPVVTWGEQHSATPKELQALAEALGAALREQLGKEFELVESPGPGTMRMRTAITTVHESEVSIEFEILDAASSERLVAVVDARSDSHAEAFAFWANRSRARLAAFRNFDGAQAALDEAAED